MKKKLFALMMAMVMVLSLAACGGDSGTTDDTTDDTTNDASNTTGTAGGTFKIGTIGPLTGDNAIYGQAVANGAKIAVDEINAAGGDIQFELQSEDDVADGETLSLIHISVIGFPKMLYRDPHRLPSLSARAFTARKNSLSKIRDTATITAVQAKRSSVWK